MPRSIHRRVSRRVLRRTLVATVAAGLGLTLVAAPVQAEPETLGGHHGAGHRGPEVVAHHGAAGVAPENTIAAIEQALADDADAVEVEVQRSSDGHLVVVQDLSLARTTNVEDVFPGRSPWLVRDFTLAELRQLDAGSWFGAEFAGERIPTLQEAIAAVGYRDGLVIDITNPQFYPGIEQDIVDLLTSRYGRLYLAIALRYDNLHVQSAGVASAEAFHTLLPQVPVGVVFNGIPADETLVAISGWAERADVLYQRAEQPLVDRVKGLGLELYVHTVNTVELAQRYADRGVDGVVTEVPALIADAIG